MVYATDRRNSIASCMIVAVCWMGRTEHLNHGTHGAVARARSSGLSVSANNSAHYGYLRSPSSHAARRVLTVSQYSGLSGDEAYGSRGCAASRSLARR